MLDITKIINEVDANCDHAYISEEDFRIDFVNAIKNKYKGSLVLCEYSTPGGGEKIDVFIFYKNKKYAIELKYLPHKNYFGDKQIFNEVSYTRGESKSECTEVSLTKYNPFKYYIISTYSKDGIVEDFNKLQDIRKKKIGDNCYSIVLSNYDKIFENKNNGEEKLNEEVFNQINGYTSELVRNSVVIKASNKLLKNFRFVVTEI